MTDPTSYASTIVIADWGQPHLVDLVLRGLVKNSRYAHKILVVTSDPALDRREKGSMNLRARDWELDPESGALSRRFDSTEHLAQERRGWLEEHGIEIVDVTREAMEHRARYRTGQVYPGKTEPEDGVDIAFKNNWGIGLCKTEWVLPNWDADMYPGKDWDKSLVDYARHAAAKEALVPTHVQPHFFENPPAWSDPWTEARLCNSRLAMPTAHNHRELGAWVTEEEWDAFCARCRRLQAIRERAGERLKLHWNPIMIRKSDVDRLGRYSYKGPGYDLDLDDVIARDGFTKVSFMDSFILHKGVHFTGD
jgi:hypothetical protein